jgi:hypothetical protein
MDVCFEEISIIAVISEKVKIFSVSISGGHRRESPAQVSDFSTSASGASLDFAVRRSRRAVGFNR